MSHIQEKVLQEAPVKSDGIDEKFNGALDKARLLYGNIEVYDGYQCALLWNGKHFGREEFISMYMGNDGEIHSVHLDYKLVNYDKMATRYPYKPVHMVYFKELGPTGTMGLIAHNGFKVTEPNFVNITDIRNEFLLAVTYHNREDGYVYDYNGNVYLRLYGRAWVPANHVPMKDEEAYLIIEETKSKDEQLKPTNRFKIFAVYKGKLYRLLDFKVDCKVIVNSNGFIIAYDGSEYPEKVIKRYNAAELIEKAMEDSEHTEIMLDKRGGKD